MGAEEARPPLRPRMSANERLCFEAAVAGRRHLVEYGAGGSTIAALERGVGRIDSVESDPAWIERLSQRPEVRTAVASRRLTLHHADIGPVGPWGTPVDASGRARWPRYARDIWTPIDGRAVDAVLVDGRFRAACILVALAETPPGTPIIVHDFWDRPEYALVLPAVLPTLRAETLAILQARRPVDRVALAALAETVAFDPA